MPDYYENCGTDTKTLTIPWGSPKIVRINIGTVPALLQWEIISTVKSNPSANNLLKFSLRGGTRSGYNIVYFGQSQSVTLPPGYIMAQDVEYIDLYAEQHVYSGAYDPSNTITLTYKVYCPEYHGARVDLHWSFDTAAHSCDLNYLYSEGHGEGDANGYTGRLPFMVEGGTLAVGKKIFALPSTLVEGNGTSYENFMNVNDRALQYGTNPNPYHDVLLVGNGYPKYSSNLQSELTVFKPSSGFYSDGENSYEVNTSNTIVSIADCRRDYRFESNHYRSGSNAYISCYHSEGLGPVASDVDISFRIRGNTTNTIMDRTLTVFEGTNSNFQNFPLDPGFSGTEGLTFTPLSALPVQDLKFRYFKPPY